MAEGKCAFPAGTDAGKRVGFPAGYAYRYYRKVKKFSVL
jgi:hypothetical protein